MLQSPSKILSDGQLQADPQNTGIHRDVEFNVGSKSSHKGILHTELHPGSAYRKILIALEVE